jgi:hypothetical protein
MNSLRKSTIAGAMMMGLLLAGCATGGSWKAANDAPDASYASPAGMHDPGLPAWEEIQAP